jgi:hypothetical protein
LRWARALEVDSQSLSIQEAAFALAALNRLPADPQAHAMLKKLLRQAQPTLLRRMS